MSAVIPAIHTAAGEVDHDIGAVDFGSPRAKALAVPDHATRRAAAHRVAAENHHLVPIADEGASQHFSDLSGTAWDHDFHVHRILCELPGQATQDRDRLLRPRAPRMPARE